MAADTSTEHGVHRGGLFPLVGFGRDQLHLLI